MYLCIQCVCACASEPKDNLRCHAQGHYSHPLKQGQLGWAGWPARPRDPPVSTSPALGLQTH